MSFIEDSVNKFISSAGYSRESAFYECSYENEVYTIKRLVVNFDYWYRTVTRSSNDMEIKCSSVQISNQEKISYCH